MEMAWHRFMELKDGQTLLNTGRIYTKGDLFDHWRLLKSIYTSGGIRGYSAVDDDIKQRNLLSSCSCLQERCPLDETPFGVRVDWMDCEEEALLNDLV
mmetsp:Transcript_5037/g.12750  ORF Transcript_5037/g.12750 Transcript_5037/m.12750 type:complete len:98 (+) Transcript_5037:138-431(+)